MMETALHIAVKKSDVKRVRELLEEGENPDAYCVKQWTPLMYAVVEKNEEIVDLLIDYDVYLNAQNATWDTALHMAIEQGSFSIFRSIIDAGANLKIPGFNGITPFRLALAIGNNRIIQYFFNCIDRLSDDDQIRAKSYRLEKVFE